MSTEVNKTRVWTRGNIVAIANISISDRKMFLRFVHRPVPLCVNQVAW
jgi:hypothetical protein